MHILLSVTRQQMRSALDRVLGTAATPERILRELQISIVRQRAEDTNGRRSTVRSLFRSTAGATVLGDVFRQLRTAAEKSGRR